MKKLLIHNDNTTLIDSFSSPIPIKFLFSNDIDRYIDESIIKKLEKEDFNIIYIKDNLSSNYLELYGLRVAYHIRLSTQLKDKRFVPIVILSDIDEIILNRLEPMARILFTENIFLIKNTKEAFDDFQDRDLKNLTTKEYQNSFLNLINVEAPENSTSHNIANEWAIYRWAEFLKVESEAIKTNNNKISSMLYFKYLLAKNPIPFNNNEENNKVLNNSGKVLLIDDESDKGWGDIFNRFFSGDGNKDTKIEFIIYNDDNRNTNLNSIDIIILDLRITKEDHNKDIKIEELTGVKFAQEIKKVNPGIQIIMFTATGSSLILEELHKYDILGYIKKEHPTDKNISIKENFNKLAYLVDKGLDKSYLKEIWNIQNTVLKLDISSKITFEVKSVFEILNSSMENKFNYAMFAIFKCIENITSLYVEEKDRKAYWIEGKEIQNTGYYHKRKNDDTSNLEHIENENENKKNNKKLGNTSTENKIRTIMNEKLGLKSNKLHSHIKCLVCIRNHTIHQDKEYEELDFCKKVVEEKISKKDILDWFKMLQTILEKVSNGKSSN